MKPEADWPIDEDLVVHLLRDQAPGWEAPLEAVGSGWDNQMYRLGHDWAVRLPRRRAAVPLLEKELKWLPVVGPGLPLPVPVPLLCGAPSDRFPWPWAIQPWLAGRTAEAEVPDPDQAPVLASFWRALHRPAPVEAPVNPFRGGPLAARNRAHQERLSHLAAQGFVLDAPLVQVWDEALRAPCDLAPTWIHADLHPRNLLVRRGRLAGVIDWGDLTVGDPAVDLAAAFLVFDGPVVQREALAAYGAVSEATLRRALGWALAFGVIFLDAGTGDDRASTLLGQTILDRVREFVTP